MASGYSEVLSPVEARHSAGRRSSSIRRWAQVSIAAQVLFVASWLIAVSWQGQGYSVLKDSISEMYAVDAPHGIVLVIVYTICGAATLCFALRSVWPALRPGGWAAAVGSILLALSVAGLGDLLSVTERLACRYGIDPGCTTARMISNSGGKMDNTMTSIGVLALVLAGFFLAHAMRRMPTWQAWAWPVRLTAILLLVFTVGDVAVASLSGLFERLVAATAAAGLAALAVGILRRSHAAATAEGRRTP
jgi:hypothetical protein